MRSRSMARTSTRNACCNSMSPAPTCAERWIRERVSEPRRRFLFSCRFQNHGAALVAGDDAVKLFQFFRTAYGHAELFHFEGAGIADHVALHFRFRVIAGKAIVGQRAEED